MDEKIGDSVKQFYDDTLKSARDKARPDLIKVLTYKSAAAVEWLQDVFNLDLTLVSRLGYVGLTVREFFADLSQWTFTAPNAPRSRCKVPRYGHNLRFNATA